MVARVSLVRRLRWYSHATPSRLRAHATSLVRHRAWDCCMYRAWYVVFWEPVTV